MALHTQSRRKTEEGFVLVFAAISLVVLMGIAGFCVDVGRWYLMISRLQNAADAASLAGAPYLPQDPAAATQAAKDSLSQNGILDADQIVSIEQVPGRPTYLRVRLSGTVNNSFLSLLSASLNKQSFIRTAVGVYRGAMPMGSPSNVLGNEPAGSGRWSTTPSLQSNFWITAEGAAENKAAGDRWNTDQCYDSNTYGCDKSKNTENIDDGLDYVIHIPSTVANHVLVQAYDMPLVDIKDDSSNNYCSGHNVGNAVGLQLPSDPPDLYAPISDSPYCPQDIVDAGKTPTDMTTLVTAPPDSPDKGAVISGCTQTFKGYDGDIPTLLKSTPSGYQTTAAAFHHWFTLCDIPIGSGAVPGDYHLKVKVSKNDYGYNNFSLRAGVPNADGTIDATQSAGINLFAGGKLVVETSARDATVDSEFYLVKLPTSQAGENMTVNLFDIGDADSSADLQILPPPEATSGGNLMTNFVGCTIQGPSPNTKATTVAPDCSKNGLSRAQDNGQLLTFSIPVPQDYKCSDTDPLGCWVRIKIHYPGGGFTSDCTSWQVDMGDAPLRLVPNQ